MKTPILFSLIALSLAEFANASGPPIITITTADAGISYHLENTNARTEKNAKTLEEVEEWLRGLLKQSQEELVMIYPDDRTSFKAVSDLLRCMKAAGVVQFAVTTLESTNGGQTSHSVIGKTDRIWSREVAAPAVK